MMTKNKKLKTFIDLFCGIGGFHLALKKHGLECVFASEINIQATKAYARNFGVLPMGDITKIKAKDIPKHDVLCAGFPCQSFSLAGRKEGDLTLFYEIIRILKHRKPKVILLENVPYLKTMKGGKIMNEIDTQLFKAGYWVEHKILNASEYGIPQKRERIYFVGTRGYSNVNFTGFPEPTHERTSVLAGIDGVDNRGHEFTTKPAEWFREIKSLSAEEIEKRVQKKPYTIILGGMRNKKSGKRIQGSRLFSPHGHAPTLTAEHGSEYFRFDDGTMRKLTIPEMKRLMTFPDDHIVNSTREIGNAVMPAMVDKIFSKIV